MSKVGATTTRLIVRSTPPIFDPRELETILRFSLKNLFGELEPHSDTFTVVTLPKNHDECLNKKNSTTANNDDDDNVDNDANYTRHKKHKTRKSSSSTTSDGNEEVDCSGNSPPPPPLLQVECAPESARFIQAALTWTTLPLYMEGVLYRIDVVSVDSARSLCVQE